MSRAMVRAIGGDLPAWIASFKGDGNWDDVAYGRDDSRKFQAGWRWCCYPDCNWMVNLHSVACQGHTALVGGPKRILPVGNLADLSKTLEEQSFDYELAVDALTQEMVEAAAARMFR